MSRRRRKQAVLERANTMGIQGYGPYGGRDITIPAALLTQMLQNLAPQKNQAKDFAPGSPLRPYEGVVPAGGPRTFAFPVGYNITNNDRTLGMPDIPSFAQLRNLAQLYSGITLCERVILDMIPKLTPKVGIRPDLAEDGMEEKKYQKEISKWRKFVEMPDSLQQMDIHSWLRMAWTDQTQIDALALYKLKNRGGQLQSLQLVDGTTVKPLLDERGMVPQPPFPAYQQYPYGVPGDQYSTEQMIYYRESPRSFTPYGFSRVERIILEVNQALRKKRKDLARFTEGNMPAGIMEVPDTSAWTPDQIDAYEQAWNSLLAGNEQQQVRVRFTQPGMKYTEFADYTQSEHMTEFDEFLFNISVASYGLSMGDVGFTEDIHKSSGDSQQNMMFRRTLFPLISVYASMFTRVLSEAYGNDNLVVTFAGFEEPEDLQAQASAYSMLVQNAIISPAGVARLMKLPEVAETGPFILPKGGQPVFLDDLANPELRKAQQDAQMAGLQMAANPPEPNAQIPGGDNAKSSDGSSDNGDDGEVDKAMGAADKAASSLERFDPVRGPGGEFGYEGKAKSTSGHHGGSKKGSHHTKGPRVPMKQRMHARMQKLSARFAKLASRKVGAHWSEAQAKAAGQLKDTFSKLADAISKGGQSDAIDSLLDTAHSQAKGVFAGNAKGMNAFAGALTTIDKANDKGLLRGVGIEDDEEEGEFDDLEEMLDSMEDEQDMLARVSDVLASVEEHLRQIRAEREEEQSEQRAFENTEEQAPRTSDAGRGDSGDATPGTQQDAIQPTTAGVDSAKSVSQEYKRWRARAIDDARNGKSQRGFTTTVIPAHVHTYISGELARCTTADDVRALFKRVQDGPIPHWQDDYPAIGKKLEALDEAGVETLTWKARPGACDNCLPNDGQTVRVGMKFKSGARIPPEHGGCGCDYIDDKGRVWTWTGVDGEYKQVQEEK